MFFRKNVSQNTHKKKTFLFKEKAFLKKLINGKLLVVRFSAYEKYKTSLFGQPWNLDQPYKIFSKGPTVERSPQARNNFEV